jgi:hypothetical protein
MRAIFLRRAKVSECVLRHKAKYRLSVLPVMFPNAEIYPSVVNMRSVRYAESYRTAVVGLWLKFKLTGLLRRAAVQIPSRKQQQTTAWLHATQRRRSCHERGSSRLTGWWIDRVVDRLTHIQTNLLTDELSGYLLLLLPLTLQPGMGQSLLQEIPPFLTINCGFLPISEPYSRCILLNTFLPT